MIKRNKELRNMKEREIEKHMKKEKLRNILRKRNWETYKEREIEKHMKKEKLRRI